MRISPLREWLALMGCIAAAMVGFFVAFEMRSERARLIGMITTSGVFFLLTHRFSRAYMRRLKP